jgi:hypothetical protein
MLKRRILQIANSIFNLIGLQLVRKRVSTQRWSLEDFYIHGTEREWQQLVMYCHVMDKIKAIPGDIAEFGVAGGTSFLSLLRLNKVYDPYRDHKYAKRVLFGFDTFEGLPYFDDKKDIGIKLPRDMKKGGFNASSEYTKLMQVIADEANVKFYKGIFDETVPVFFEENKHATFSLIHVDCDLHQSTVAALSETLPRLNVGGVILFDEIFHQNFPGETSGFWEVYNSLVDEHSHITLEFERVTSMPWKWYAVRTK